MLIKIDTIQPKHKAGINILVEAINQADDLGYSLTDEWLDYIIQNASKNVFIATSEENLIGLASCMMSETDRTHAVINIIVHPKYRKKGVGSRLHKQVIKFSKENNIKTLEAYIKERLHSTVEFAEKRGFRANAYAWEMSLDVKQGVANLLSNNHKGLIFRQASLQDNDLYVNIIGQTFGDALGGGILEELLQDPSVQVFILEKDGQAIGSTTIQLKANLSLGYIYDVAILKPYRGQGLGSYMLKRSIGVLDTNGIGTASLLVTGQNKGALALYKRLGFKEKDVDILGTIPI